jgi:hypothetical protein
MAFYTVSNTDPRMLSHSELQQEVDDVKRELASIESRIAEKRAWADVDGAVAPDYNAWRAKSLNFRSRLISRYMELKPVLKALNSANRHEKSA